jgi:putative toxin-antitoxin system antitoxin component (TIGR02293 family)
MPKEIRQLAKMTAPTRRPAKARKKNRGIRPSPRAAGFREEDRPFDGLVIDGISGAAAPKAPVLRAMPGSLAALRGLGYSEAEINALVVPRRTLARREAQNEPLSVEETDKALRLERIATLAMQIFGQADKANGWLRKPKRQLEGETPLNFLRSENGARIVEDMLRRIEYGILA